MAPQLRMSRAKTHICVTIDDCRNLTLFVVIHTRLYADSLNICSHSVLQHLSLEAMASSGSCALPLEMEEKVEEKIEEEMGEEEAEEFKKKLEDIVEGEAVMKGPTATKHFKEYLVLWTGRRQVEAYAKCFRFAKSLSGKPQLDRFKQLADAVVKSQSLQEAIAQGLVPAPPDDNPSEGSVARARRYQTQKRKEEEEKRGRGVSLMRK